MPDMGTAWVNEYIEKFFTVVNPQIRKENLRSFLKLMSLGEYDMAIPAGDFIIRTFEDAGMSITLHCPEPVPTSAQVIGIMKGSPHPNAAKLFANWLLSKEGQIAGFRADASIPSNKGLTGGEFQAYPDEIVGRKLVFRTSEVRANVGNVVKAFNRYWLAGGGGDKKRR